MIELGTKVRDMVTDFEGIVIARTVYLNGCVRYAVQAKLLKDGKVPDTQWIDEPQLKIVGDGVSVKSSPTGGDREDPVVRENPKA
jgi:hypothetical protein